MLSPSPTTNCKTGSEDFLREYAQRGGGFAWKILGHVALLKKRSGNNFQEQLTGGVGSNVRSILFREEEEAPRGAGEKARGVKSEDFNENELPSGKRQGR